MSRHEQQLAAAFDGQAPLFEKAPVQTDPGLLSWLVAQAEVPPASSMLDAGCGPGLVSAAFLEAGHRVLGVDLSGEMIERACRRGASHGNKARFQQGSIFNNALSELFDAAVSRFVLHHMPDPLKFVCRQVELLKPGGILVLCDHTTDPDPPTAVWHRELECDRDQTHTQNLSPGKLLDLFAQAGLADLRLGERSFTLDFDEWFDRGTPRAPKEDVRSRLLSGPASRGFRPEPLPGGAIRIHGWIATVRGVLPSRDR